MKAILKNPIAMGYIKIPAGEEIQIIKDDSFTLRAYYRGIEFSVKPEDVEIIAG